MKKFFLISLFSLLFLISFEVKAVPTSVSPTSLSNWYGDSNNNVTGGGNTAVGDFNCDDINDVIMSTSDYSSGKGRIYVVFGGSSFSGSTQLNSSNVDIAIRGTDSNDGLGDSISLMDIDGDGCDDIISLGGDYASNINNLQVFLGSISWDEAYTGVDYDDDEDTDNYFQDADSVANYTLETSTTGQSYHYLHLLGPLDGDVTGDGVTDDLDNYLAMCSSSTLKCFLIPVMNLTGSDTIENLSSYQITVGDSIYDAIASGDLDGDGSEDLIVGNSSDYSGTEGVNIFFGPLSSSSSLQYDASETPADYFVVGTISGEDIVIRDASAYEGFGGIVKATSLIDSDYDDLIIGSINDDNGSYTQSGHYHIISGESIKDFRDAYPSSEGFVICNEDTTGTCTTDHGYNYTNLEMFYYTGDANESYYGDAYNAYSGDFNGDGLTDLALGSDLYDTSGGALHIIYGGKFDELMALGEDNHLGSGYANSDYYMLGSSPSNDALATNVIAGDVTGDGYDDLIVTASGAVGGYGATYLWTGGATTTYYLDDDGDGYGDSGESIQNTSTPSGYVTDSTDCDDTDATLTTATTYYVDSDGDGYGSTTSAELCVSSMPAGYETNDDDCNDANASLYTTTTYYRDNDGDGYGGSISASLCAASAPAGYASNSTDCNDSNASVNPSEIELCSTSGIDDNCDGSVDENSASDASIYYRDSDSDGYGNASVTTASCSLPSGYSTNDTDCDDTNSSVNPSAGESIAECGDGVDQNCDGTDLSCSSSDADGDGYSTGAGDCDDTNASINPGEDESCDGLDNNCNGTTDEATAIDALTWYLDNDGDSYGDASNSVAACTAADHYVDNDLDCDDTNATSSPTGSEICGDDIDQNCDGADLECTGTGTDADSDGITVESGDCDDDNNTVYPGAEEIGDAIDNDCDDSIDEGLMLVELTSLSESVEAGDTFRVDLTLQNNTGFGNFDVLVLVQKDSVNGVSSGGAASGPVYKFMWRNWGCGSENENCDTVLESVASITNNGSERTLPLMATMPEDKESGKSYFIQVQFIDRNTGKKIAQTKSLPILYSAMMAAGSGTASGSVRPTIQVE